MPDQLCFVQFPHPGREHAPDITNGTYKSWGSDQNEHRRKFMHVKGAWRDDREAPIQEGEIVFWGEWEAASTVARVGSRVASGPHWIHRPFFEGLKHAPTDGIRQNTDPFVFGDRFLYTYCRQPRNRKLRTLARGSLILFGSKKDGRFVVDTVFIVANSVDHTIDTHLETAARTTSEIFRLTTLSPMYEQGAKGCRLYYGATTERPVNGMFSFVPCLPASERRSFARPVIDLPEPLIKPTRTQQAATIPFVDAGMLADVWHRVVAQVVATGCALGVSVGLPGPRPRPSRS